MQLKLNNIFVRHSYSTKEKVRELRQSGLSLNAIFTQTLVPKTTIRTWIGDIKLSSKQLSTLKENTQRALQNGRIRKQELQKKTRLGRETELSKRGINEISRMTRRDILITGIALYWAEGFKNRHEHRLGFCNSDPGMIKFYIKWLREILGVKNEDIVARLTLNESYKNKTQGIINYWAEIVGIPHSQFSKTFYQKAKWKKYYNNNNYYGVLRIHVKNSLDHLSLMKGWIEGLKLNVIK